MQPVRLAVFDFDGTSMNGNSPVLLVRYLASKRLLSPLTVLKIALWGAAYKFRLPQNEAWVRGQVFKAFEGWEQKRADEFLRTFYDEWIDERFRADAEAEMRRLTDEGCEVLLVSATFEPIVERAQEKHPVIKHLIATRMQVDEQGRYTRWIDGAPIEGAEKLTAVQRFADARYGAGNWELAYAYGDHHSDRAILRAAQTACAVMPDRPLTRTARECGWRVLNWS